MLFIFWDYYAFLLKHGLPRRSRKRSSLRDKSKFWIDLSCMSSRGGASRHRPFALFSVRVRAPVRPPSPFVSVSPLHEFPCHLPLSSSPLTRAAPATTVARICRVAKNKIHRRNNAVHAMVGRGKLRGNVQLGRRESLFLNRRRQGADSAGASFPLSSKPLSSPTECPSPRLARPFPFLFLWEGRREGEGRLHRGDLGIGRRIPPPSYICGIGRERGWRRTAERNPGEYVNVGMEEVKH